MDKFPDRKAYKLSDMFAELDEESLGRLELEVEVYNINEGRNAEMVRRSEALKGYSYFIYLVREYGKAMDRDAAIKQAIEDCISQNVLKKFLKENAPAVLNMLLTGWNWDIALAKKKEEGFAEGEAIGMEKLLALWEKGVPLAEAKQKLGLK